MYKYKYSVVIPVFNSEKIVATTVKGLLDVREKYGLDLEIILVNDGSQDNSWEVIRDLAEKYRKVTAINLLKNFGQHNAVLCGFAYSSGDYVITMDDDMQNPPEEIIKLINAVEQNDYDLVFGKFKRKRHSFVRRMGTKIVNYLNRKIFGKPKDIVLSNFRIIKRRVVELVLQHDTPYPYIPGLLLMYSSDIANVEVEHKPRLVGKSNYNISRILALVSRILINYSSFPLKVLSFSGLIISLMAFLIGLFYLLKALFKGISVPGWTTLVVLLSFFSGFIIGLLGLIGEYLARILEQISHKKSYVVKQVVKREDNGQN